MTEKLSPLDDVLRALGKVDSVRDQPACLIMKGESSAPLRYNSSGPSSARALSDLGPHG
jgi:hypothetical protein